MASIITTSTYCGTLSTNCFHRGPDDEFTTWPLAPISAPPLLLADLDSQPEPRTEGELRQQFVKYLQWCCSNYRFLPRIEDACKWRYTGRWLWSLQVLALDSDSTIRRLNLQEFTKVTGPGGLSRHKYLGCMVLVPRDTVIKIEAAWYNKTIRSPWPKGEGEDSADEDSDSMSSPEQGDAEAVRRAKDLKDVEEHVKEWYGGYCILTGTRHLTRAQSILGEEFRKEGSPIWRQLHTLWPHGMYRLMHIKEEENILPLACHAQVLLEKHLLGLRPMQHASDPSRILYLQVIFFDDLFFETGLSSKRPEPITDLVDVRPGTYPRQIRHGDVFKLVTRDPINRPLPRFSCLKIRYAIQGLLAIQRCYDALKHVFGGPPPDVETSGLLFRLASNDSSLPWDWEEDLNTAVRHGILDRELRQKWETAILQDKHRKAAEAWNEG
ncbi:hypothetical protein OQA88_12651 [Cercophora sp. LCS_1]